MLLFYTPNLQQLRLHPNYSSSSTRWSQLSHLQKLTRSEVEEERGTSSWMQVMGVVGEGRRSSEDPVDAVAVLVAGELWSWLCPHACIEPAAIIHTFSLFSVILLSLVLELQPEPSKLINSTTRQGFDAFIQPEQNRKWRYAC